MEQPVILIAEDEPIVGMDLSDTITEAGYEVEGPHGDLHSAMLAFQKRKPDLAILDIRLHDTVVFPFAEKLMAEDVPVIFHSATCRLRKCPTASLMRWRWPSRARPATSSRRFT